jgi:ABC-type multidrug transport system fused ATPase/permease subunit
MPAAAARGTKTLCQGQVEFKHVTFSRDRKAPTVKDLTFTGAPGEVVALVGATGAGKSTAMALLYSRV